MKLFGCLMVGKDGGPESNVSGVLFELKGLFSFGLLRFKDGSREAFHSHAFHCWSLLLSGALLEEHLDPRNGFKLHEAWDDILTYRTDVHKVHSIGTSWVFTVRGPWKTSWVDVAELPPEHGGWNVATLTDGRRVSRMRSFPTREAAALAAAEAAK